MTNFRRILNERGMTPTSAARVSGVPYDTIAAHYYGKKNLSPESAMRYEATLGIPKEELRPDIWRNDPAKDRRTEPHE